MKYIDMASKYDKLTYDVNYKEIVGFYKDMIEKYNIIGRDALELGCGTGNITSLLSGYNIIALDNSDEMLSIAKSKLYNRRNIKFLNMDIRDFDFDKKFDFCYAALDTINYINNLEDVKKVFENVYKHLKENSIFIFDINSEMKIKDYIGNNIFSDEVGDTLYIWQGNYNEENRTNEYLLTFFVEEDDGRYRRFSETHQETAYSENTLTELLEEIGFKKIETYDEFTKNKSSEESMRISFVAYKGEI